jgi:hypothetical protein
MASPKQPDPRAQLNKVLGELEKRLGKGMIHPASAAPPVYHVSFQNPTLNYATEGGAPWDRATTMWGDPSTGKTLALFQLYTMAQRLPGSMDPLLVKRIAVPPGARALRCRRSSRGRARVDPRPLPRRRLVLPLRHRGAVRQGRAAKVGVDLDALYLVESNVIEDVCTTLEGLWGLFNVHGLDSTSAASSCCRSSRRSARAPATASTRGSGRSRSSTPSRTSGRSRTAAASRTCS